jgi:hypothetical protein
MAKGYEVLQMLIPNGGWYISGDKFEDIKFLECEPLTKTEYETGFAQYDAWKDEQDKAKAQAKTQAEAKLLALGLSIDDLVALGLAQSS